MNNPISEITVEFNDLVETMFKLAPKEPKSVPINFNLGNVKVFFNVLTYIFTYGYRKIEENNGRFIPKINFEKLNEDTLDLLKKYFASFGIVYNYKLFENQEIDSFFESNPLSQIYFDIKQIKSNMENSLLEPNRLLPYYFCNSNNVSDYNLVIKGDLRTFCLWFTFL
jgi:hypothetical protein